MTELFSLTLKTIKGQVSQVQSQTPYMGKFFCITSNDMLTIRTIQTWQGQMVSNHPQKLLGCSKYEFKIACIV